MSSKKINEMKSLIKKYEGKFVTIEGQITGDVFLKGPVSTYILYVSAIECEGVVNHVNTKVKIIDFKNNGNYIIPYNGVHIGGKVQNTNRYNNIGMSDYYNSFLKEGIFGVLIADYSAHINSYDCGKRPVGKFLYEIKRGIFEILERYTSGRSLGVLKGLLFGDTSEIGEDDYEKFKNSGIIHVFAVSGYNIWLFFYILSNAFLFLNNHKKSKTFLIIALLGMYTAMSGASPSVVRAFSMASLMLLGRLRERRADPLTSLALSGFVILMFSPLSIMDVGFLLSFASTASIILLFPVLKNVKLPLRGRIMDMALLSLSVQIGMLPLILYYFNSFPVFAIAANLIILPIISAVTVIGIVILILHFLFPGAALFAGFIIDLALDTVFYMTDVISSLPYGNLNIISPGIFEVLLYYLAIGVGFKLIKLKGYRRRAANFFVIALLLLSLAAELFPSELKICFIDVGQGDCILITTPDRKNILIDGGGKPESPYSTIDIGEDVLLPYLYRNRVNKIHMVISTHPHEDHLKGLIPVMSSFDVGMFVFNSFSEEYKEAFEISGFGEHKVIDVEAGNIIKIGKDVDLYVLSPMEEEHDENDSSIVMKLVYKDFTALFTGDISAKVENKLLTYDIKSDVLKVPHHGSSTSLDENFLDRVDPEIAVICVGHNNFGHPADITLDKINKRKISLFRTDKHGEVRIKTRGKGVKVETAI